MKKGIELINEERKRQIEKEGWTSTHDDLHSTGALSRAALCYREAIDANAPMPRRWPWASEWWKPADRLRNLVKAGALYLAEHDRYVRMAYLERAEFYTSIVLEVAEEIDKLLATKGKSKSWEFEFGQSLLIISVPTQLNDLLWHFGTSDPELRHWDFFRFSYTASKKWYGLELVAGPLYVIYTRPQAGYAVVGGGQHG